MWNVTLPVVAVSLSALQLATSFATAIFFAGIWVERKHAAQMAANAPAPLEVADARADHDDHQRLRDFVQQSINRALEMEQTVPLQRADDIVLRCVVEEKLLVGSANGVWLRK